MTEVQARIVALVGVLLIFIGIGLAAVIPGGFDSFSRYISVAGAGLLVIAALMAFGSIVSLLRTRQGRYGLNVITSTFLVFGILAALNFLSSRYSLRRDLSASGRFSLAPQTESVLEGLTDDVVLYALVPENDPRHGIVRDLLREYAHASGRVTARNIRLSRDPASAERLAVKENDAIAVEVNGRVERLKVFTEHAVTNAIVRAARNERKRLYFLSAHGEKDPNDEDVSGYSQARDLLREENYEVLTHSPKEDSTVPDDCDALIVAGPDLPLLSFETESILAYLDRGGRVLLAIDPVREGDSLSTLGTDPILAPLGIELGRGVVLDASEASIQLGAGYFKPTVTSYGSHPITAGFRNERTLFSRARPVRVVASGVPTAVLLETDRRSWEEMDVFRGDETLRPDEGRAATGPLPLAVAMWLPAREFEPDTSRAADPALRFRRPETRLVVVGDSDFACNEFVQYQRNKDFFLNSVSWLAGEEDLIAVRPKDPENRVLHVTTTQRKIIRMTSMVLYPALVLALGVAVWARRRRQDV